MKPMLQTLVAAFALILSLLDLLVGTPDNPEGFRTLEIEPMMR